MCCCIDRMNDALAEYNARLDVPLVIDLRTGQAASVLRVKIACYKINSRSREKLPALLANFCPFCGERCRPDGDPPEMAPNLAPNSPELECE